MGGYYSVHECKTCLDSLVKAAGKEEGRSQSGGINIWPIDMLNKGDIYVADGYLKVRLEH